MKYYSFDDDLEFIYTENAEVDFKKHNHISKYIVGLVLNGSLCITQDDDKKLCCKDDIFIIPVYITHSICNVQNGTSYLSMCIGEKIIKKMQSDTKCLYRYIHKFCDDGIINEKQAQALCDTSDVIIGLYLNRKTEFSEDIERASSLIINNTPESLEQIADEIYISKYYLIHKFKAEMGLTPHYFQIQNRIRKAQNLLCKGNKISYVAVETGFYDQSHFIKEFRKIVGMSPSEYISSYKKLNIK